MGALTSSLLLSSLELSDTKVYEPQIRPVCRQAQDTIPICPPVISQKAAMGALTGPNPLYHRDD